MSGTSDGTGSGSAATDRHGGELVVWAPLASSVEVDELGLGRRRLACGEGGTWTGAPAQAPYFLVVDGFEMPDPRSPAQPDGFDGRSHPVDFAEFVWTDAAWSARELADSVLYELHVGTFTPDGTFDAVVDRLDHLVALGVDAIELMPVNTFPGRRGWGYDGVQWFAPHPAYGGPAGLQRLVDACHARGVAVVLDVVYNHLGPLGNHLARLGPWFTDRISTPWGSAVDLDGPESAGVRRTIVDNARHWIEHYHVDGLRLDAVHALHDRSPVHIVAEVAEAVRDAGRRAGRRTFVVVESDLNDPVVVEDPTRGGWGADAAWSDDLHHALHVALTGEQRGYYGDFTGIADVATALEHVFVYSGGHAPSRGRVHGRPAGDVPRERFLAYSQTHDQVGNRPLGERLEHLAGPDAARAAAATVVLSPFVPMLFQGEEWAASAPFLYVTDHPDAELARAIQEGRAREFADLHLGTEPPDPQDIATFERSTLDWREPGRPGHAEMLQWYRELIALRRRRLQGRHFPCRVEFDDARGWWRMDHGPLAVVVAVPRPGGGEHVTVPVRWTDEQVELGRAVRDGRGWQLARGAVAVVSARCTTAERSD